MVPELDPVTPVRYIFLQGEITLTDAQKAELKKLADKHFEATARHAVAKVAYDMWDGKTQQKYADLKLAEAEMGEARADLELAVSQYQTYGSRDVPKAPPRSLWEEIFGHKANERWMKL